VQSLGQQLCVADSCSSGSGPVWAGSEGAPTEFDFGFLVGLLVGEGSFSGDRNYPAVVIGMHTDHAEVFRWLGSHFPGGRVYGPYQYGIRKVFRWRATGPFLSGTLIPILDKYLHPRYSRRVFRRYLAMKHRYGLGVGSEQLAALTEYKDDGISSSMQRPDWLPSVRPIATRRPHPWKGLPRKGKGMFHDLQLPGEPGL
jgi:hypothetical protein